MHDLIRIPMSIVHGNSGLDRVTYLLRGAAWAVAKRAGIGFVVRTWNGARIKVSPNSAYSGLFYFKHPEGRDMEFLRANAALGNVLVDVGANVGLFSALVADKFATVILFEPSNDCFTAVQSMAKLNQGMTEFELHNLAITDHKGSMRFLRDGDLSSTGRLVEDGSQDQVGVTSVLADTLDNVLGDRFDRIVMKMDIEGGEERAFLGASRLFRDKRVKLVMFERLGRTNLDAIRGFMAQHGYKLFRVLGDGALTTTEELVAVPLVNLFACPEAEFKGLVRIGRVGGISRGE